MQTIDQEHTEEIDAVRIYNTVYQETGSHAAAANAIKAILQAEEEEE